MTSPTQTVSADAALQIQAGQALKMHSEGIISDMTKLRNLTQNLPAGLQGATLGATMDAHGVLHAQVIRQAQRLAQHGDHFVKSANAQTEVDQTHQRMVAQTVSGSVGSSDISNSLSA